MKDQENIIKNLSQNWSMPSNRTPIVIIGAGGIVNDAHLPAYQKAGFKVKGIYDIDNKKAKDLAEKFTINKVFDTFEEAIEDNECIFDLALPPANLLEVASKLPNDSFAIFQKPLGRTLEEAKKIKEICNIKNIKASREHLYPNVYARFMYLVSIKEIKTGEELTANYNLYTYPKTGVGFQTF